MNSRAAARESDIINTVFSLLRLYPRGADVDRRMVITIAPALWCSRLAVISAPSNAEGAGGSWKILDVSPLVGAADVSGLFEPDLETHVVRQLVQAGWPRDAIVAHYRENLRSDFTADLALLDGEGTCQVAIELVPGARRPDSDLPATIRKLRERTSAMWFCVTDGVDFHLFDRETGGHQTVHRALAPWEIGVHVPQDPGAAGPDASILRPLSAEEMAASVAGYAPENVIVDPTLMMSPAINGPVPEPGLLAVIDLIETPRIRIPDAQRVFSAWASTLPSVRTLSTVLDAHAATSPGERGLRTTLARRLQLSGVIELPPFALRQLRKPKLSIVYLGGDRDRTYFDAVTARSDLHGPESRPWLASLQGWMEGEEPPSGYTTGNRAMTAWSYAANSPEVSEIHSRIERLGEEVVELGELCEIYRGGGPYRGQEAPDQDTPEHIVMQVDDLLLSEYGPEHGSVLVERADVRGTLQPGTLALRLKDGRLSPEYLMEYLNSATARTLVAATTVSRMQGMMTRIAVERLREIPVPLVSISTFEDLDSVETELRAKADELSTLRRSLFEARDARAFREQLGELTRLGSMLSTSIESSGQLQFQISNAYPYPIAYGYRLLNSYAGPWERYLEQLRVAENMLAFLASLSLSILQKEDLAAAEIDIGKLWEGGVAFGSWKRVIEKCAGVFESYRNHPLASALAGLDITSGKRGFGADVNALISARNNLGHGREAFAEVAIRRASNEAQERLHRCMEALAFLIAFPIYQVQDMDLNDDGIRLDLKCLLYRGDHPGLEQRIVVSPRAEKKNRLFIDVGHGGWVSIYPFLTIDICPTCRAREVFFIESWERAKKRVTLKSFERGHTERSQEIDRTLKQIRA